MARVRDGVWARSSATTGTGRVLLDIDASLHQVHSENKAEAAANYKGGYGLHPIYCFADATGEALGVLLRPGNAGANNIADHVTVLDQAIAGLPAEIAVEHREGDDPALVRRDIQVRTDSAGCTGFVRHARARNVGFAVVARSNAQVHAAISRAIAEPDRWQPAIRQDGEPRPGAQVAELTDLVDLADWPTGTRLVVRREPLHPGAQQSLLPSLSFRYWGHNRARLAVVCFADALVRWFQLLCLTGHLAAAEPKPCVGACGTPPPASSATPGAASCASSTAGPTPPPSSPPTTASPCSPEPIATTPTHPARA
ncbi:MAG: transposase [Acidimicrobiales bacterium]